MAEAAQFQVTVDAEGGNVRLDQFITAYAASAIDAGMSRTAAQRLIEAGLVSINGSVELRPGCRLRAGDQVAFSYQKPEVRLIVPQEMPLTILYEDDAILAVNKPPGLTVHPGAGQRDGTLLNALAHHLNETHIFSEASRPWVVHRLDKDTSGVLVIAKTESAHRNLSQQFQQRSVEKEYRALVIATPRQKNTQLNGDSGVIDLPIGRHPTQRVRMGVVKEKGRAAVTRWQLVERFEYGAYLSITIETGRTHQIRVHFEAIGAPIIGDRTYGNFQALPKVLLREHEKFGRQALHAQRLTVLHPQSEKQITFEAPLPPDMEGLISKWREYHG